MKAMKITNR